MSTPTGPADFQPRTESNFPTVDFPRECHIVLRDCGLIEPSGLELYTFTSATTAKSSSVTNSSATSSCWARADSSMP